MLLLASYGSDISGNVYSFMHPRSSIQSEVFGVQTSSLGIAFYGVSRHVLPRRFV